MRIQHNIIAMNAYRNYTTNTSAMQKNLERLSSGYKINRAGDDAAGLAISEKMRAQITGLEAASKNAKDGVSLVQTAEGALTEVHDMLNRMVELATMSANGTYNSETDRTQLQKEMDQLNDEINRIADSANFNGIKLLDGSMDSTIKAAANTIKGDQSLYISNIHRTRFHEDGGEAGATSFTINFDQINITEKGDDTTHKVMVSLEIYTDSTDQVVGAYVNDGADKTTTGAANNAGVRGGNSGAGAPLSNVFQIAVEVDEGDSNDVILNKIINALGGKATFKFAMNGKVTAGDDFGGDTAAASTWGGTDDDIFTVEYDVSIVNGNLKFTMTEQGQKDAQAFYDANKDANKDIADSLFRGDFNYAVCNKSTSANQADWWATSDPNGVWATTVVKDGGPKGAGQLALFVADFNEGDIKDGSGIRIGDDYYIFAGSDKTYNATYSSNVHVVDIRDLVNENGVVLKDVKYEATNKTDAFGKFTKALDRLTVAAENNSKFIVGSNQAGDCLTITEREDSGIGSDLKIGANFTGDPTAQGADLTDLDNYNWVGLTKHLGKFNSLDMAAAQSGEALTLQIGDTADSYNQLKVNIADCHTASLGLDGLSIADQVSAGEAVDVIKDAINQVSDIRGTLGATQNRLDHTLNNLSVMTENIQDAESTIRDTDVAEEMMAYTKNNILIQAAQAMLAQANQIPQGVLQLLQ